MTEQTSMPAAPRSPKRALGRCPRAFDQTIPHMSSLRMLKRSVPSIPAEVHWLRDIGLRDWGMMNNNRLGCCTLAAAYHMMQVWSHYGRGKVLTETDEYVEQAYRELAGYDGTPATDNGAVEQDILRKWLNKGVPIAEGTAEDPRPGRSHIVFYGEIDVRNLDDVKQAIHDCGGVYIGFNVPAWLMEENVLPETWDVEAGRNSTIVGGHAIGLHGFDNSEETFDLLSWGSEYKMTYEFFRRNVDEVYAVANKWWFDATGKTPLGLDPVQLAELMHAQERRV